MKLNIQLFGGRGAYLNPSGFTTYKYETVDRIGEFKVIREKNIKDKQTTSLPQMSSHANENYILENAVGDRKQIGIYDKYRRIDKYIDFSHGHNIRDKNNKVVKRLKRGVAHIHFVKGGRDNNVRYLNQKEIKKYGKIIVELGGKLYE